MHLFLKSSAILTYYKEFFVGFNEIGRTGGIAVALTMYNRDHRKALNLNGRDQISETLVEQFEDLQKNTAFKQI